jgi:hypothetical protein
MVRIDVEKDIVPAFAFEPTTKRHGIGIVLGRMTQKNARHDSFPDGTRPKARVKMQMEIVTMRERPVFAYPITTGHQLAVRFARPLRVISRRDRLRLSWRGA